ncbi:HK97 family phage prohead protease [Melissococcus plutonius]|uniref:HK97 family phage prohead protease n=1 Tax=Melissococcus plutonius TaxID=33970 RepID=UPI003C2C5C52
MRIIKKEIRARTLDLETRQVDQSNKKEICGYAVVFDEPSENLGGFIEKISPHAFDDVDMRNVLCLYNHDTANILARSDSSNLNLSIDTKGLYFEATLPDTTLARDVYANIDVGNVKGCSFGFTVAKDNWIWSKDGSPDERTIEKIDQLFEITLTPIPAYQDTNVAKRAIENKKQRLQQTFDLLEFFKLEE